jgi:hypothetical protein
MVLLLNPPLVILNAHTDIFFSCHLEKDTPENVKQFWKQNAEEILNCTIAYTTLLETTKGMAASDDFSTAYELAFHTHPLPSI